MLPWPGTPVVLLQPVVESLECQFPFETHVCYLLDLFILQLWLDVA